MANTDLGIPKTLAIPIPMWADCYGVLRKLGQELTQHAAEIAVKLQTGDVYQFNASVSMEGIPEPLNFLVQLVPSSS